MPSPASLIEPCEQRQSCSRTLLHSKSAFGELVDKLWNDPEELESSSIQMRSSAFRRTVCFECGGERFVMKHYLEPRIPYAAKRAILPSHARRSWEVAQRLTSLGILTPLPVAYVENRVGPFRRDSFFVYPYLEGITLRERIIRLTAAGNRDCRDMLLEQLGVMWQVLLLHRISLPDANTGNFIVTPARQVAIIDVDGIRFHTQMLTARWHQAKAWRKLIKCAEFHAASARASLQTGVPNSRAMAA